MKKLILGMVLGIGLSTTATAFANTEVTGILTSFKMLVNGKSVEVKNTPVVVDGTSYFPLREIGNMLGYEIEYDDKSRTIGLANDGQKYLNNSAQTPVQAPTSQPKAEISTEKGNIKGAITWQYNNVIGTKGDVGAQIYLIPENFDKDSISKSEASMFTLIGSVPKNTNLNYTKVNGYGNYELNNVPVGNYYIVIVSKNTNRDLREPISDYDVSVLKPLMSDWDNFAKFRLQSNKHEVKLIEVTANETIDISNDFGNTFF